MVTVQWANMEQAKTNNIRQLWKQWEYNGLHDIQSAQQIKTIMQVETIQKYVEQMKQFPPFSEHFIVHGDNGPIEYQYLDSTTWIRINMPSIDELQNRLINLLVISLIHNVITKFNYMH